MSDIEVKEFKESLIKNFVEDFMSEESHELWRTNLNNLDGNIDLKSFINSYKYPLNENVFIEKFNYHRHKNLLIDNYNNLCFVIPFDYGQVIHHFCSFSDILSKKYYLLNGIIILHDCLAFVYYNNQIFTCYKYLK